MRAAVVVVATACAGCTTIRELPAAPPPSVASDVYFYPRLGQTPERQDRDRYACATWARRTTGFDPAAAGPYAYAPRVIAAPAPHTDATVGAMTGGALGAAIGRSFGGAALGAIAGGLIGAAADVDREQQIQRLASRPDGSAAGARAYHRALAACLSGRGYAVD